MRALVLSGIFLIAVIALSGCGGDNIDSPLDPGVPETMSKGTLEGSEVMLDIKPRVDPNYIRQMRRGVLRAAIVGTESFDVRDVDVSTIRLLGLPPRRACVRDITSPRDYAGETTTYRVNCGGPLVVDDGEDWILDTTEDRSPYVNTGFSATTAAAIDMSHPSIPAGTPMGVFQSERWDWTDDPEMRWDFPVNDGTYTVRLYFADHYPPNHVVGARVFDVSIEGSLVLDDYDIFADVGGFAGVVKEFTVPVVDGAITIDFGHVVENPNVSAIEILGANEDPTFVRSMADGYDDLVVMFNKRRLRRRLGDVRRGDEIELTVRGELLDGTPFEASDVMIIGGPRR